MTLRALALWSLLWLTACPEKAAPTSSVTRTDAGDFCDIKTDYR